MFILKKYAKNTFSPALFGCIQSPLCPANRTQTQTAVPVDVIQLRQVGQTTARFDLTSLINANAPSFNYNKQSGSDGADHIDLATLRGLGPDQTLVLVNGKRRHQTAFVAVFGARGRGNSGTDLSALPAAALSKWAGTGVAFSPASP
jgi:iron complex outermembrane receptor protein